MGPPRRTPSLSNNSNAKSHPNTPSQRPPKPQRQQPEQAPNLGMSPASRYNHNLKVLRRRDPSIVSIFDQFSHVCVYHHNGNKWEKNGYEGSMFLYERESYPPYGFYILNRMGMDDYIQRLYPEDDIGAHGSYLMLRAYPDFTARRLAAAANVSSPSGDKFSPKYAIPNLEKLQPKDKGRSQTRGLWMFATDAREPMIAVMLRLHSFIKKNIPYPEEFRYGPDRPPPPNPYLSSDSRSISYPKPQATTSDEDSSDADAEHTMDVSPGEQSYASPPSRALTNGGAGGSELDKLFARLGTTEEPPSPSPPLPAVGTTSKMTVESLFAALSGTDISEQSPVPPASSAPNPNPTPPPNRGLALLDTIFASATPPPSSALNPSFTFPDPPSAPPSTRLTPAEARAHPMPLPLPAGPTPPILSPKPRPQVLNQDVISSLLGLPGSRSSSAASSRRSGVYQGDNEGSDGGASDEGSGYSESSTVLDAEPDVELQAAGSSSGIPLLSLPDHGAADAAGRVQGDVTPRPPLRSELRAYGDGGGVQTSTPPPPERSPARSRSQLQRVPPVSSSSIISPTPDSTAPPVPLATRPLVPFEADSELWPYPRPPLDDRSDEIIELDFSDTSALSDPEKFEEKAGKKRKGKKGKKQRQEEKEKEREAIERSWDVPPSISAPPPAPAANAEVKTPILNGKSLRALPPQASSSATVPAVNGKSPHHDISRLDVGSARDSLVATFSSHLQSTGQLKGMEKNEFVREVLTLVHTDKDFVDGLWKDYMARLG